MKLKYNFCFSFFYRIPFWPFFISSCRISKLFVFFLIWTWFDILYPIENKLLHLFILLDTVTVKKKGRFVVVGNWEGENERKENGSVKSKQFGLETRKCYKKNRNCISLNFHIDTFFSNLVFPRQLYWINTEIHVHSFSYYSTCELGSVSCLKIKPGRKIKDSNIEIWRQCFFICSI